MINYMLILEDKEREKDWKFMLIIYIQSYIFTPPKYLAQGLAQVVFNKYVLIHLNS